MGTYLKLVLKDKSEKNIKKVNKILEKQGYPTERFNRVVYGAFVSNSQLKEDARFMNEDEEGLEQSPHLQRPITAKFLEGFFWNTIGEYHCKISCYDDDSLKGLKILSKWMKTNGVTEYLDLEKSEHYSDLDSYLYQ